MSDDASPPPPPLKFGDELDLNVWAGVFMPLAFVGIHVGLGMLFVFAQKFPREKDKEYARQVAPQLLTGLALIIYWSMYLPAVAEGQMSGDTYSETDAADRDGGVASGDTIPLRYNYHHTYPMLIFASVAFSGFSAIAFFRSLDTDVKLARLVTVRIVGGALILPYAMFFHYNSPMVNYSFLLGVIMLCVTVVFEISHDVFEQKRRSCLHMTKVFCSAATYLTLLITAVILFAGAMDVEKKDANPAITPYNEDDRVQMIRNECIFGILSGIAIFFLGGVNWALGRSDEEAMPKTTSGAAAAKPLISPDV